MSPDPDGEAKGRGDSEFDVKICGAGKGFEDPHALTTDADRRSKNIYKTYEFSTAVEEGRGGGV